MQDVTLRERFQYWFDNVMARGAVALIGWLGLLSAVLIVVVASLIFMTGAAPQPEGGERPGFGELLWMSLMRAMDAGTVAGDTGTPLYLGLWLLVTVGGIFVVSMLIGLLTTGIEARLDELRKGRSRVIEQEHTVILGWSSHVFTLVSELVEANKSRGKACVAILADRDKVEMEDDIKSRVPDTAGTHVVCRSGNPVDAADLDIVNPQTARSIIILSPQDAKERDTHVIKTLLALVNSATRRKEPYHIVAEIESPRNLDVARMVGKDECALLLTRDVISRIAVQTCRQSGLSVVYTELMDFGGDEIYFQEEPRLVGKTYGEALTSYESCAVIGVRKTDGRILINPPMDEKLAHGDRVIVIAEDDDKVALGGTPSVDAQVIAEHAERTPPPERTLYLGWNDNVPLMISELDEYVAKGSLITVVADSKGAEEAVESLRARVKNAELAFRHGDTNDRALLDALDVTGYDHVITVSYSETMDEEDADAHTLITLLHLRDICDRAGRSVPIVSEMLNPRNRDIAEVTKADDFIVSDRLVSLLMCQISENRELAGVFGTLFESEGSEIYLKPAADYVAPGKPVSFYTVTEAARRRGETAIGYRLAKDQRNADAAYGIKVNPRKSDRLSFSDEDRVVVLAES